MLERLTSLVDGLALWGAIIGLAIAALIAWVISSLLWSEFHAGLFVGIAIPCVMVGTYWQYQVEKGE